MTCLTDTSSATRPAVRPRSARTILQLRTPAATITDLAGLAARESVEIVASPYTGADLGLLAAEGWRDGLEQVQMGKQELSPHWRWRLLWPARMHPTSVSLARVLPTTPMRPWTTWSWAPTCKALSAETVAPGTVAVRAENTEGDRVTLVFAPSDLSAAVGRALGCERLQRSSCRRAWPRLREVALVIAPRDVFGLMPLQYVQKIGEILTSQSWIRTQKLQELLGAHSPDSRPVLLQETAPQLEDYIETRSDGERQAGTRTGERLGRGSRYHKDRSGRGISVPATWQRVGGGRARAPVRHEASYGSGLSLGRLERALKNELAKVRFLNADSPLIAER